MKTEKIRGLVGLARRSRGLTTGSRETRAGMRRSEVHLVLLASDGSPRDQERLVRAAEEAGVPARVVGTMDELGSWVGRETVTALGLTDSNLAAGLLDRIDGARRTDGGQKR